MNSPNRISSIGKPEVFENLGNGKWYYNYDIKSEQHTYFSMERGNIEVTETVYNYIQIKMAGRPTYKRCVELMIREYLTQSQEFDLINSYNRATLNLLSEDETEKVTEDYFNYLQLVSEIKSKVKKDFE